MIPINRPDPRARIIHFGQIPVWLGGWKSYWVLGAGLYVFIFSLWILFKWTNPEYETLIANVGYLPLGTFTVISSIYVVNQKHLDQRVRRAWKFITLSIIFSVLADIIYTFLELTRGVRFPDLPDFFYLAYYPLIFIGVFSIPSKTSDLSQERTWTYDLAITISSIIAISWYFIIAPTAFAGGKDWVSRLVAGTYPALDVLLVAGIASRLFRKSEINTRQSMYIFGLGLLIYAFTDTLYAWLVLNDLYSSGLWVDILYTITYFLVGLAAMRQASLHRSEDDNSRKSKINWQSSFLPYLMVSASLFTLLYAGISGEEDRVRTYGLVIGTAISILLISTRQIITVRENSKLVDDLSTASEQLNASAEILKENVKERTLDLENQIHRMRVVAEIARDAASALDLVNFLEKSAQLILERFHLYHVGIFITDNKNEFVTLTASPTHIGRRMLEENYRVHVGEPSNVGRVAATGEPRITLDVDREAGLTKNPLLPNTRSQITLPLKVNTKVIGILDVHSELTNAFNQDDISIMQILADQLTTAIERTRLLQEVEQNLSELERAYGQYTREGWQRLSASGRLVNKGYRFNNIRIEPLREYPNWEDMETGRNHDINSTIPLSKNPIELPIKLRGQTVGFIHAKLKDEYGENTISTLQFAIERLASALESARLYEEASIRADREQAISQITAAINSSTEYESILQATVREIGNIIPDTEVAIQIYDEIDHAVMSK